ncbi:VWA domain-containing protein [Candidatus Riflebacteria bacterium]
MATKKELLELKNRWVEHWEEALSFWSSYTMLKQPQFCFTGKEEKSEALTGSFAMIRLEDLQIILSLRQVKELSLDDFALEIMAHEIGHHVYCPADLTDHGRMLARMRAALPGQEHSAPMLCNLYSDLLINDRLQRPGKLKMPELYRALGTVSGSKVWFLYLRIYEILWNLQRGYLCGLNIPKLVEGDAALGARLLRIYSKDWLRGAGRFAALFLPYLIEEGENAGLLKALQGWYDTKNIGSNGIPNGLTEIDDEELEGTIHPALDPEISGFDRDDEGDEEQAGITDNKQPGESAGQHREPFQYGELLKAMGINLTPLELAIRYYRERALPHLIPFPSIDIPESKEPLPEGLTIWDPGLPLQSVDWLESIMVSPRVIPGYTTVQRSWGTAEGAQPEKEPIDLDIYIDSSGSMPNPQHSISYLTLAGAIMCLSSLRAGCRVKATLWSGTRQFTTTADFIRDEKKILGILCGFFGGSTAFPIHQLRETYQHRKENSRRVHIMVISDEGVDTMYRTDEKGNKGADIVNMTLKKCRAGGTLLLNLYRRWQEDTTLKRASEDGWDIHRVTDWQEMIAFARAFSRRTFAKEKKR